MTAVQIAHDGKGYRVYRTDDGIHRSYAGPTWPTPREAARYADSIAVPYVDPIRASDEDAPREHRVPHAVDELASSSEPRISRGSRRHRRRQ